MKVVDTTGLVKTADVTRMTRREKAKVRRARAGEVYEEPRANPVLMWITRFLIHHLGFSGMPLLAPLFRWLDIFPWFRGVRMRGIDFPADHLARARAAASKDTAAFIAPNHPEFFTDFLMGHAVGSMISRKLAFWVGFDLVNGPLRIIWLRHNLIANAPGGGGKRYSRKAALRGDGVFIHPEGDVGWTGHTVQKVFAGVAHLPLTCFDDERYDGRDVFIVPLAYRYRFCEDPSRGLRREMDLIEARLSLPPTTGDVGERFFALQRHLLARQAAAHDVDLPPVTDENFFDLQDRFFTALQEGLEEDLGLESRGHPADRIVAIEQRLRVVRRTAENGEQRYRAGNRRFQEMRRAYHFSRRCYGTDELTLEQVAESLKRIRQDLFTGRFWDWLRAMMPFPVADRVAHVRTLAPILVNDYRHLPLEEAEEKLVARYRRELQAGLDELTAELAGDTPTVPNPFAVAVAPAKVAKVASAASA